MILENLTIPEIGWSAIPIPADSMITQILNPFGIIISLGVTFIANSIVAEECAHYSEGKHDKFRRDFQSRPGMSAFTGFEGNREQRITYDDQGNIVRDSSLQRDRFMTAVSLWLYIPSILIACDRATRSAFIQECNLYGFTPQFTSEMLKRTRYSTCGLFQIQSIVSKTAASAFLVAFPQFKGTVADPEFLCTPQGIQEFVGQMVYCHSHSGNYIPFIAANKRSLPQMESGFQTTFGSLISESSSGVVSVFVNISNSYRNGQPDRLHVADCMLLAPTVDNKDYTNGIKNTHTGYEFRLPTKERLIQYLVRRVLGIALKDNMSTDSSTTSSASASTTASAVKLRSNSVHGHLLRTDRGRRIWLTPSDFNTLRRTVRHYRK